MNSAESQPKNSLNSFLNSPQSRSHREPGVFQENVYARASGSRSSLFLHVAGDGQRRLVLRLTETHNAGRTGRKVRS